MSRRRRHSGGDPRRERTDGARRASARPPARIIPGSVAESELVEIFREVTGEGLEDADRRCPTCGVEGQPDSAINLRLFFCSGCGDNYFLPH